MVLESFLTNNLAPALLEEVEQFLDSQDTAHPFQFPQWVDPGSRLVLLRASGRIGWVGVFSVHRPLGWKIPWIRAAGANRGPVGDDLKLWEVAADLLVEEMRREGLAYLDVSPEWIHQSVADSLSFFENTAWKCVDAQRVSLRLDLNPHVDELFANFSKTTRYEVRRAERLGVTVTAATNNAEVEEFLRLYHALSARKDFQPDSLQRVRRQIHCLMATQSRGVLLLARADQVIRGGVVVGRSGKRCWYIWGASERQQHLSVGHVLQWKALQWAKSQGCTEYDFGGYTPGATSGPAWFKAGFGGTAVHFVAPHRRVIRPGSYRVFSLLANIR